MIVSNSKPYYFFTNGPVNIAEEVDLGKFALKPI